MSATVNANLLRIAASFVSTEEKRYYLKGVLIQRHQLKGVVLVATDGHRLISIHDENGTTTLDDVIVRMDKAIIAACKSVKGENMERIVKIEGDGALQVLRGDEDRMPVAMAAGVIIDGTFPHWQRVANVDTKQEHGATSFNPDYLADFGKVATELAKAGGRKTVGVTIVPFGDNPALIRFLGIDHAFGVLMPVRGTEATLPWFLNAAPAELPKAA